MIGGESGGRHRVGLSQSPSSVCARSVPDSSFALRIGLAIPADNGEGFPNVTRVREAGDLVSERGLISAVHHERDLLPQRPMRLDLVGERREVLDRLGYGRRLLDLALAGCSSTQ